MATTHLGTVLSIICRASGTEYAPSSEPPESCPTCLDERQYVASAGPLWTTPGAVQGHFRNQFQELEPGLAKVEHRGGLATIAIRHPHCYPSCCAWSEAWAEYRCCYGRPTATTSPPVTEGRARVLQGRVSEPDHVAVT